MVKQGNKILFIFFLIWAIVCSTPILGKSLYFAALLAVSIVFIALNSSSFRFHRAIYWSVFLYIALIFVYKLIGYSSTEWGNYMHQLSFFIPLLLMFLIPDMLSNRQKTLLWWLVIAVMLFNIADNIYLSILYPSLNSVSRFYQDEEFLASINAGGSPFYTFSLLFFNVCFFVFLNSKKKKIKFAALAAAVICAIYILGFCLKASVVVYFLLSLFLQYFAYRTSNTFLFFFVIGFTAILGIAVITVFQDSIVDFIISVSPDERLTTRLVTLIDAENAEADISTATNRTSLYLLSVETWLSDISNFLFGIGDHRAAFGAKATGIGQHSDLLDSLARYGLLGLVILVTIFKNLFKYLLSLFGRQYKLQLVTIFVIFIMCGLTKGIFLPGVGCVMFLLLPLSKDIIIKSKE